MNTAHLTHVDEILDGWKSFRSGHQSIDSVREIIIRAKENGVDFFKENSAPKLGTAMIGDRSLRHELTAAEMAYDKRAEMVEANNFVVVLPRLGSDEVRYFQSGSYGKPDGHWGGSSQAQLMSEEDAYRLHAEVDAWAARDTGPKPEVGRLVGGEYKMHWEGLPEPLLDRSAKAWISQRADTNPYASYIAKQNNLETIWTSSKIPEETSVPQLSPQQKQAAVSDHPDIQNTIKDLRSSTEDYYKDGQSAFQHIQRQIQNGQLDRDTIGSAGDAKPFRIGLLGRADSDAQQTALNSLVRSIESYNETHKRVWDQVDAKDQAFRSALTEVTLHDERLSLVAETGAHPTKIDQDSAHETLAGIKGRYEQSELRRGAGLTPEAARQLETLTSQVLPAVMSRPLQQEHDLSAFDQETSLTGILMDLSGANITSETAHGVIATLERLGAPEMQRVLEAEAKDYSELPAQASMLASLIRDKAPVLKAAIGRSEYYDQSDIAVMGEAEVNRLSLQHISEDQRRLDAAISPDALRANLTKVARPEASEQVKARPDLRLG